MNRGKFDRMKNRDWMKYSLGSSVQIDDDIDGGNHDLGGDKHDDYQHRVSKTSKDWQMDSARGPDDHAT